MAKRKQQISVVLGINQRIGMGPVGEKYGVAVHVQVVECVPNPRRISICIEINNSVARDDCLSGIALKIVEGLRIGNQQKQMTVRQQDKVVVDRLDLKIVAGGLKLLGKSVGVELPDQIACQIDFAHRGCGGGGY